MTEMENKCYSSLIYRLHMNSKACLELSLHAVVEVSEIQAPAGMFQRQNAVKLLVFAFGQCCTPSIFAGAEHKVLRLLYSPYGKKSALYDCQIEAR